jgi:Tol biopolymer transport system component/DNA-binding winged helix-turn-helix (wHTH) protein
MPEMPVLKRIRFGDFTADLASQELFRSGNLVRIPNQSFLALAALLEKPGQLVSREELRSRLWPGNRVVEFEQALNAVINRLREALGDEADSPTYVETLPRRGYRFIGTLIEDQPRADGTRPEHSAPIVRPVRRVAPWLIGAAAAGLLLVAASLSWRWKNAGDEGAGTATVAPLTSLVGVEHMPALSPDGTQLAFAWNGESPGAEGFDLYVRPLQSERHSRLTQSPAPNIAPAWSPDGSRIAFARSGSSGGLFLIPATGGDERRLADAVMAQESLAQPAWSPDGRTLAYADVDASGSQVLRLLTLATLASNALQAAPACWHAGAPAWIDDGRHLAFVCMTSVAVYDVYLAEPGATRAPRLLARLQGFPRGMAWSSERARLLIANDGGDGGGIWELELDGRLHRPVIGEESLGSGVSAAGKFRVYSRSRRQIEIWRVALAPEGANTASRWIFSTREQLTPQYSPDGARIAFQSNRSGTPEIWLADADGGNAARLTSIDGPLTGAPAWCSDGRRLAFDSRESGESAIYILDVYERVPRRLETPQPNLALPTWSRDCEWLLASDGRAALYRVPARGGEARKFTSRRSYQAVLAGDRVIFNVAQPGGVTLWMKPSEGGEDPDEETAVPGMPRLAYADAWTADDSAIYFTGRSSERAAVFRYDLATRAIREVATLPAEPAPLGGLGLAISPDGGSLLYTHIADTQSDLALTGARTPR